MPAPNLAMVFGRVYELLSFQGRLRARRLIRPAKAELASSNSLGRECVQSGQAAKLTR